MSLRGLATAAVCTTLIVSACSSPQERARTIHEVADDEVPVPEAVTSVSEIGWEWRPDEEETALAVHAQSRGAVIELEDGLVGLQGDTGNELWRYRLPEATALSTSFSPSGEHALVAASDEPAVLLDTSTGAVVAEDIDWDGEAHLLDHTRLLHHRGEATEALFTVSDLESGKTLWRQETPKTCSGGGPSRLVSRLLHSEAIVLLLHCSENTSQEALRAPESDTVNALVALSPNDGRDLWRQESADSEGRGLVSALMLQGTLAADLPGEEGWLIIDPVDGTLIAESPKPVLAVGEDTYLAGPDPWAEDPTHELRTFDGEVAASVTLSEDRWAGDTPETAIGLPEQLISVDMERGSPEDAVNAVVTPWDGGRDDVITATTTGTASRIDPGRLLSVPGAVLVYVPVDHAADIDSVEHVVALR